MKLNRQDGRQVHLQLSVFQSPADTWAIDQVLPIMPNHRLEERAPAFGQYCKDPDPVTPDGKKSAITSTSRASKTVCQCMNCERRERLLTGYPFWSCLPGILRG